MQCCYGKLSYRNHNTEGNKLPSLWVPVGDLYLGTTVGKFIKIKAARLYQHVPLLLRLFDFRMGRGDESFFNFVLKIQLSDWLGIRSNKYGKRKANHGGERPPPK